MIFKTINSSVDETRKTLALFNKDWNTYKKNWQQGSTQNGFAGGIKSIFKSKSQNSVISKDQVRILKNWNNAVIHGCTNQKTFNRIIANADDNTKMYFAGLNKGKGSLEGLKNAQTAAKQSTLGLTIAQTALNMAISMGLMAAISLAIKSFDKLINSAKRASEAADEAFSDTNEKVQKNEDKAKSLDELISKYKELKESSYLDVDGRKEVKELQNDIADLVGTQAKNLDLVNGKLDEEIEKLNKISAKEAKNAYETATANYFNSQKAAKNAVGNDSFLFIDGLAYTGKREKKAEKVLKDAGFSNNIKSVGLFGNTLSIEDNFDNDMKELKGAQDKADYLQSMIDVLEQNGQRETDLYSGLVKQRDTYLEYINNQQSAANSLVNSWITYSQFSNEELSKITVDSVDSFKTYRKKMIEEAKNDESIGNLLADGTLSEADLKTAINNFMSTSLEFSTWYEQWLSSVQGSTSKVTTNFTNIFSLEDSEGTATTLSNLKDSINEITSAYQTLKDTSEEYRTTGALSFSTIESLIESGDDWLNYLTVEDGQLKINEQAYYNMAQAKLYELKVQALQNLSSQVKGLENVASAQAWIESQNYNTADSYKTLSDNIIQGTIAQLEAKKALAATNTDKETWQEAIDSYKQLANTLDKTFDISSILSENTSVLADSLSNAQTTADLINTVSEEIEENGEISISTLQDIASTYPILEKYVQDYMIGVEGSEEALIEQLNNLYQQDVNNYKESWKLKARDDKNFWIDFVNTCADSINNLANQYGIDLKNYADYAKAEIDINNQLAQSFQKLTLIKNASNTITTGQNIFTSAQFAGLNSTQKTQINSLWTQWQKEYMQDRSSVTRETMEQKLKTISGLDRVASAKDIAEELYHNIILLPDTQAEYDGLSSLFTQLTDSWNQYSAEYADKVSATFDDPNKLDSSSISSSSSSSDTSETFDWIETKITRLTEALDKLKTKSDSTYASWTSRNTALSQVIDKTRESINLQAQAYNRYMQEANSVGLSSHYKNLVQSGAIDISSISDETLKEQISEYQTWYEKAQNCLKTQDDLNNELNELKSQKFTNLKSEYDSIITRMQSAYDLLESQITLLSSSGDYNTLRNKQNSIIIQLQSERNVLSNTLNSSGIQAYTEEWYNLISQIDDLDQQIADAKNALKEIDSLQFDNIQEAFNFDTSVLEHGIQMIQNQIDLLEMKGQFANESYYNGMIEYTQKQLDSLTNERTQLQNILNNTLYKQGTSEWNDMYSALMEIDEEIDSMTSNLTEFNNAIRDLNWEIFEYLEESISRITDETDYLIELLSEEDLYNKDNGNLTKYADAAIGLHAVAYDTYKQQAQDYYEEVQDLQKQLVNGAGKDVLEQYNEMVDAHQDAVLAAEDEKQAILDLIEEGYNAQLEALQKLIDKKKDALNAEKDLYDYQKSIKEQTENISSLEKQKLAYEGDDSEEAMSKIQQIKVELQDAKEQLKESEYEQYLQDTENMLDQLAEDYETWMNDRLDNADALLAEIIGNISGKGDEINATLNEVANEYSTFISDTITSVFDADSPFTSTLTQGFTDVNTQLTNGLNNVSTSIAGTTTAIDKLVSQVANLVNVEAGKTNAGNGIPSNNSSSATSSGTPGGTKTTTSSGITTHGSSHTFSSSNSAANASGSNSLAGGIFIYKADSYPKNKLQTETSIVDKLKYNNFDSSFSARSQYYSKLGGSGTYTGSSSQNVWMIQKMKSMGYKKGTVNAKSGYHWTQEDGEEIILRKSDGAILTPLSSGDIVFNNESSRRLYEFANNPDKFMGNTFIDTSALIPDSVKNFSVPNLKNATKNFEYANSSTMTVGDINITMELPNATDYKSIRKAFVEDKVFKEALWNELASMPIRKMGVTNWSALNSGSGVPISMRNK